MKKENKFFLRPFSTGKTQNDFKLKAVLVRRSGILSVSYELKGPVQNLSIPVSTGKPERRNGLWVETCFELFMGPIDSEAYWEFNFSPSGNWNIYRFNAYRQGMKEEHALEALPFDIAILPDSLKLSTEIDLGKFALSKQAINVAACVVIKDINACVTYWALAHHRAKPDFHRRDGFLIEL
jgi:hypothetical protein